MSILGYFSESVFICYFETLVKIHWNVLYQIYILQCKLLSFSVSFMQLFQKSSHNEVAKLWTNAKRYIFSPFVCINDFWKWMKGAVVVLLYSLISCQKQRKRKEIEEKEYEIGSHSLYWNINVKDEYKT